MERERVEVGERERESAARHGAAFRARPSFLLTLAKFSGWRLSGALSRLLHYSGVYFAFIAKCINGFSSLWHCCLETGAFTPCLNWLALWNHSCLFNVHNSMLPKDMNFNIRKRPRKLLLRTNAPPLKRRQSKYYFVLRAKPLFPLFGLTRKRSIDVESRSKNDKILSTFFSASPPFIGTRRARSSSPSTTATSFLTSSRACTRSA